MPISNVRRFFSDLYNLFYSNDDSYYLGELDYSSQAAYERAATMHCNVVIPKKNQLQIDIDNDLQYAIYEKNLPILKEFYIVLGATETPSKSGEEARKHITVDLRDDVDDKERLILQAFLGSDLRREFLSFMRIKNSDPIPTLFFEKKPESNCDGSCGCKECEIPF